MVYPKKVTSKMNFLITGNLGFIGSHLTELVKSKGHYVVGVDSKDSYSMCPIEVDAVRSLRFQGVDEQYIVDINDFKHDMEFDVVLHLAGIPRQYEALKNQEKATNSIVNGTSSLLKNIKYKRFVYTSTSMVYGDFECGVHEFNKVKPTTLYGFLRMITESTVRETTIRDGNEYTIIRPSAVYGEYDTTNRIVGKMITDALVSGSVSVNGEHEILDFTHVSDLVRGMYLAATSPKAKNQTYNITTGTSVTNTIKDLATIISKHTGCDVVIKPRDDMYPKRGTLDTSKAFNDFGYEHKISFEDGILGVINEIKSR